MRDKLHELIRLRERVYTITEYKPSKRDWTPTKIRRKLINQFTKPVVTNFSGTRERKLKYSCAFCNGNHYHDESVEYKTVVSRRRRIGEINLCARCLRPKHFTPDCTYDRPCSYCKGSHHRALCGRRDSTLQQEEKLEREVNVVQHESPSVSSIQCRNSSSGIKEF